jgi:hypothetical protein
MFGLRLSHSICHDGSSCYVVVWGTLFFGSTVTPECTHLEVSVFHLKSRHRHASWTGVNISHLAAVLPNGSKRVTQQGQIRGFLREIPSCWGDMVEQVP